MSTFLFWATPLGLLAVALAFMAWERWREYHSYYREVQRRLPEFRFHTKRRGRYWDWS